MTTDNHIMEQLFLAMIDAALHPRGTGTVIIEAGIDGELEARHIEPEKVFKEPEDDER